jgi:hypothetical protein
MPDQPTSRLMLRECSGSTSSKSQYRYRKTLLPEPTVASAPPSIQLHRCLVVAWTRQRAAAQAKMSCGTARRLIEAQEPTPPTQVATTRILSGSKATMSAWKPGARVPSRSPRPKNIAGSREA